MQINGHIYTRNQSTFQNKTIHVSQPKDHNTLNDMIANIYDTKYTASRTYASNPNCSSQLASWNA